MSSPRPSSGTLGGQTKRNWGTCPPENGTVRAAQMLDTTQCPPTSGRMACSMAGTTLGGHGDEGTRDRHMACGRLQKLGQEGGKLGLTEPQESGLPERTAAGRGLTGASWGGWPPTPFLNLDAGHTCHCVAVPGVLETESRRLQ